VYPTVRKAYWANLDTLKYWLIGGEDALFKGLLDAVNAKKLHIVRIHPFGDFFHKIYFKAWYRVMRERPDITMFGYTKMLPYVQFLKENPLDNFKLHYSIGGKLDHLWTPDIPASFVVMKDDVVMKDGHEWSLEHDIPVICSDHSNDKGYSEDFRYIMDGKTFALKVH
jgi:hypothetical protein